MVIVKLGDEAIRKVAHANGLDAATVERAVESIAKPAPDEGPYRLTFATGAVVPCTSVTWAENGRDPVEVVVRVVDLPERGVRASLSTALRVVSLHVTGLVEYVDANTVRLAVVPASCAGCGGETVAMHLGRPVCAECRDAIARVRARVGLVAEAAKQAPPVDPAAAEKAKRREQEAALVALVNACPPDLDPVGWRAAVLAVDEMCKVTRHVSTAAWKEAECEKHLRAFAENRTVPEDAEWGWGMRSFAAVDAYRRAIAPHTAPPPERRRGGRDVRVVLDDGRDDE